MFAPYPLGSMYHVWHIYLHENHKNQPNVGKYTSPMDGMGYVNHLFSGEGKTPWDGGPLIINPIHTLYCGYLLGTLQETNVSHLGKRKNHLQICLIRRIC